MRILIICTGKCDCVIAKAFASNYPHFAAADWNSAEVLVDLGDAKWPIAKSTQPRPPYCPVCGGMTLLRLGRSTTWKGKHNA